MGEGCLYAPPSIIILASSTTPPPNRPLEECVSKNAHEERVKVKPLGFRRDLFEVRDNILAFVYAFLEFQSAHFLEFAKWFLWALIQPSIQCRISGN